MYEYKAKGNRNNKKPIQYSSAEQAVRMMLRIAKEKFYERGSSETKLFFTCLDKDSDASGWLKGMLMNMRRASE